MKRDSIIDICVVLLLALFAYAGVVKLLDDRFIASINETPILSSHAKLYTILIPGSELFVCLLLLIPRTKLLGLYGSLILMLLFTGYIGSFLLFPAKRPCVCGGILSQMGWTEHFIFNIMFTLIALTGVILERKRRKEQMRKVRMA